MSYVTPLARNGGAHEVGRNTVKNISAFQLNQANSHMFPRKVYLLLSIDGEVRLLRSVCLQMNNFRLFLHQQSDKRQTSVCTMSKWIKENHLGIHFLFNVFMSPCPCLHVSMSQFLHVSMFPCLHLHVSVSMSPSPCLHVSTFPDCENGKGKTEEGKLLFVCCKRKWKTDICFPWWANGKGIFPYKKDKHLHKTTD